MSALSLDRRRFLVSTTVVAGGMALALSPADAAVKSKASGAPVPWGPDAAKGNELSAWIEIAADDTVTIRVPNPESGNGTMTQMAMNVTEELGCAWKHIRVENASVHRDFVEDHVYTKGSLPFFGGHGTDKERMAHTLQLGASARERLKGAAAVRWTRHLGKPVSAGDIAAKDSVLTHTPTGRTLRYGEVAADAVGMTLLAEPKLKPQSEWTLIGKQSPSKLFIPDLTTGKAVYGIDVKVPGMVHAALLQAPVMGGRLKSHKPEAVLKMPGVRAVVVIDPANSRKAPMKDQTSFGLKGTTEAQHGVAVIADHFWQAKMALEALPVEWDLGPGAAVASSEAIYDSMRKLRDSGTGKEVLKSGDMSAAKGKRVVEAEYLTPYADNAVMEPLGGTALVSADACQVWCATQDARQAYWVAIDETGLNPEQVKVHGTLVGGNFGRRTQADDLRMVVAIARQFPGVPVKTIWTREEMFRQGRYRTPIATRFKAVLDDATGLPSALSGDLAFAGDRPLFHLTQGYADVPYFHIGVIPNVRLTTAAHPVHVLNGAYRGPCFNSNAFFTETFIDECAHAAGIDPLEYRLKLVAKWDKPWSDVLKLAAEKAGWGRKLPRGEGMGIAITSWPMATIHNFGSVMATVARVSVTQKGELTVRQVDIAFDTGKVANADAVHSQIEGGTIWGLNMTLNEEMTLKDGAMVEGNYDEYPMLRMADAPTDIRVHFDALSGHDRFDLIGELPVGPIGPAVGNAVFMATGIRLRATPFRKQDLSWT
jgi:isoquinoline 1-oxidoreductase subunit beta